MKSFKKLVSQSQKEISQKSGKHFYSSMTTAKNMWSGLLFLLLF